MELIRVDPRHIVSGLLTGHGVETVPNGPHEALIVAEQAIGDGHLQLVDPLLPLLNDVEREIIRYRYSQLENNANESQECLAKALAISRSQEHRDHLLEARIRMEWGVLRASLGEFEQAGVDLKWSVERLSALSAGHRWHGLALLNMAAWHRNRGESGMALAMYAEISRHGPHHVEIISLSRRLAAEIWIEKEHFYSALRNLWVAHHGYRQSNMENEAIDAGLHWIDIGLTEVSERAPTMETAIADAAPRSAGEPMARVWIHPADLRMMYDWLSTRIDDESAHGVLNDASHALQS